MLRALKSGASFIEKKTVFGCGKQDASQEQASQNGVRLAQPIVMACGDRCPGFTFFKHGGL
jgi:hypothetical protein